MSRPYDLNPYPHVYYDYIHFAAVASVLGVVSCGLACCCHFVARRCRRVWRRYGQKTPLSGRRSAPNSAPNSQHNSPAIPIANPERIYQIIDALQLYSHTGLHEHHLDPHQFSTRAASAIDPVVPHTLRVWHDVEPRSARLRGRSADEDDHSDGLADRYTHRRPVGPRRRSQIHRPGAAERLEILGSSLPGNLLDWPDRSFSAPLRGRGPQPFEPEEPQVDESTPSDGSGESSNPSSCETTQRSILDRAR